MRVFTKRSFNESGATLLNLRLYFHGGARRSPPVPQETHLSTPPNSKVFRASTATGFLMLDTSGSRRVEGGFGCEVPALVFLGVAAGVVRYLA
jgi:hypothetical protein